MKLNLWLLALLVAGSLAVSFADEEEGPLTPDAPVDVTEEPASGEEEKKKPIHDLIKKLKEKGLAATKKLKAALESLDDADLSKVEEALGKDFAKAKELAKHLREELPHIAGAINDGSLKDKLKEKFGSVKDKLKQGVQKLKEKALSVKDKVKAKFRDLKEKLQKKAKSSEDSE